MNQKTPHELAQEKLIEEDKEYSAMCYYAFIASKDGAAWLNRALERLRDEEAFNPGFPNPGQLEVAPELVPQVLQFMNGKKFGILELKKRALMYEQIIKLEKKEPAKRKERK